MIQHWFLTFFGDELGTVVLMTIVIGVLIGIAGLFGLFMHKMDRML